MTTKKTELESSQNPTIVVGKIETLKPGSNVTGPLLPVEMVRLRNSIQELTVKTKRLEALKDAALNDYQEAADELRRLKTEFQSLLSSWMDQR